MEDTHCSFAMARGGLHPDTKYPETHLMAAKGSTILPGPAPLRTWQGHPVDGATSNRFAIDRW